jgi:cation diffusion facilitator family transporter
VAILSVCSNTALILLKMAVGLLIGSVAVLSEAIHSAVDLIAALIALFAVRKASEAADERHPYGHGKFENISGTIEAVLIFIAAVWIIYSAFASVIRRNQMPGWVAVMQSKRS